MEYLIGFVVGALLVLLWCLYRRPPGETMAQSLDRINPFRAGGGGGGPIEPPKP